MYDFIMNLEIWIFMQITDKTLQAICGYEQVFQLNGTENTSNEIHSQRNKNLTLNPEINSDNHGQVGDLHIIHLQ